MGDGLYAVRRAAYRAAATCAPDNLASLTQGWAWRRPRNGDGPRRRAAECAGWFAVQPAPIAALARDAEPTKAYRQSIRQAPERALSRGYESRVLAVAAPDHVIKEWRYGVALGSVGADGTFWRLDSRIKEDLPPAVRMWLPRVRKAVEERWRGVTGDWPQPWFEQQGRLEKFAGTLSIGSNAAGANGILRLAETDRPGGRRSWGGWGTASQSVSPDEASLAISGRRDARVLGTWAQAAFGQDLIFVGTVRIQMGLTQPVRTESVPRGAGLPTRVGHGQASNDQAPATMTPTVPRATAPNTKSIAYRSTSRAIAGEADHERSV